ncbi:MAG: ATP phosphoribosyltransferase [Dehalococcoidia bacterium]
MSASTDLVRVALPRGDLRTPLAERLDAVGFHVEGYGSGARTYQFDVDDRPGVRVRVFSDRDIPIQVALGQYDLGIASRAWIDELLVKYRLDSLVPIRPLDVGEARLILAGVAGIDVRALARDRVLRVTTEYPNLAERLLNRLGVPDYRLYDVWGNAAAWLPEDADLALLPPSGAVADALEEVFEAHRGSAWLIGNRDALGRRDLSAALDPLLRLPAGAPGGGPAEPRPLGLAPGRRSMPGRDLEVLRLAVPDGHAQRHTVEALAAAGIAFEGYEFGASVRRPTSDIPGLEVKVMRPQDMPRAVALGRFDLALTGRDWLASHLATFPAAPIAELGDLGRSRYELGAVVPEDLPADTIEDAIAHWRRDDPSRPIRVASEYVPLADRYARDRHLGRYRVIPISGASEGFVPDDADILIEGSETGTTLRANRLRMLDVIMISTNCIIGAREEPAGPRGALRRDLVERLVAAAPAALAPAGGD